MQFRLFETSVYENRRKGLKENIKSGLILLMGNEESGMNYKDNWYPFRQAIYRFKLFFTPGS